MIEKYKKFIGILLCVIGLLSTGLNSIPELFVGMHVLCALFSVLITTTGTGLTVTAFMEKKIKHLSDAITDNTKDIEAPELDSSDVSNPLKATNSSSYHTSMQPILSRSEKEERKTLEQLNILQQRFEHLELELNVLKAKKSTKISSTTIADAPRGIFRDNAKNKSSIWGLDHSSDDSGQESLGVHKR